MPSTPRKRLEKSEKDVQLPVSQQKFYCCRCGISYSRLKGYFPVSHSPMYRGTGYLPWCNDCVDKLFDEYRKKFGDDRKAMRHMCMKFDMYWSDAIYDMVERSAGVHSKVRSYIAKTNIIRYIDKTFDNTLEEEELRRVSGQNESVNSSIYKSDNPDEINEQQEEIEVPDDVVLFWGPGYKPEMYMELEDRKKYFMSRYPDGYVFDIGEEALIRQICNLEIDINHDRSAGKSIDKNVNTLNALLGSLNLKPAQKKGDEADAELDNMPFGVGIKRWENTRPVPDPDPELQDVDGIVKYISVWFLGHLCKMLGIKNSYCKLYEDEMDRLRVSTPEYEDEDDEALFNNIFKEDQEE